MLMKVGINARLLSVPTLRGWNRYTVNLLAELPAQGVELYLYGDRPLHPHHLARLPPGSYQVRVASPTRYLWWEQYWLPRQCGADRVDVLHSPFNFGLPWFCPCPRVLTLHDAIDQVYSAPAGSWRDRLRLAAVQAAWMRWSARTRAEHLITVSEHARRDLVGPLGVDPRRITVIYEAADPHFQQPVLPEHRAQVQARYGLWKPYLFYVGGWEKRKNIPFLLRAFAASGLREVEVVLAGGSKEEQPALHALSAELGIIEQVRFLGWVPEEDLPSLYAAALCFVYPSAYEGFGLQLCEAMAVGCPVLAARATSLPEILGHGGDTFSLTDSAEAAALIRRVALEEDYRDELRRRSRARSPAFSWEAAAQQTVAVYGQLGGVRSAACPNAAVGQ